MWEFSIEFLKQFLIKCLVKFVKKYFDEFLKKILRNFFRKFLRNPWRDFPRIISKVISDGVPEGTHGNQKEFLEADYLKEAWEKFVEELLDEFLL